MNRFFGTYHFSLLGFKTYYFPVATIDFVILCFVRAIVFVGFIFALNKNFNNQKKSDDNSHYDLKIRSIGFDVAILSKPVDFDEEEDLEDQETTLFRSQISSKRIFCLLV